MTNRSIKESQLKAARVTGLAYLITFSTLVSVNFGYLRNITELLAFI